MNKEERKRLINANYGLNYNKKLENSHIDYKHLEKNQFTRKCNLHAYQFDNCK